MSCHQFLQNTRAWKVASNALKFKELKTLLASLTPIPNTLILQIVPNSTFALTESPLVNKDVNWDWSTTKTANLVTLPKTCLNGKYFWVWDSTNFAKTLFSIQKSAISAKLDFGICEETWKCLCFWKLNKSFLSRYIWRYSLEQSREDLTRTRLDVECISLDIIEWCKH